MSPKRKSATMPRTKEGNQKVAGWQANRFLRPLILAGVVVVALGIVLLKEPRQPVALSTAPNSPTLAAGSPAVQGSATATQARFNGGAQADELNQALAQGKPALVFMHSSTCQTCKYMMEVVDEVYPEFASQVVLVDVDIYDEANSALTQDLGLRYIPTIVLFDKEGNPWQKVGAIKADAFRSFLRQRAAGG